MVQIGERTATDFSNDAEHCLDELDEKAARCIRTAFFEGVTYDVLAEREGTPLGTMKSWIRRGLQRLKACLER